MRLCICFQDVDIALGPLGVSEERHQAIDMSMPLFVDQQVIAYARPKLEPDLAGFVKPFTPMVSVLNSNCLFFMHSFLRFNVIPCTDPLLFCV